MFGQVGSIKVKWFQMLVIYEGWGCVILEFFRKVERARYCVSVFVGWIMFKCVERLGHGNLESLLEILFFRQQQQKCTIIIMVIDSKTSKTGEF